MKNFNDARRERAKRDRTFVIGEGDVEFTYRASVEPEALITWNSATDEDHSEAEWLALFDETVTAFLEPGQEEKWSQVRHPENGGEPLSIEDMQDVIRWLFTEAARRPTGESSDSSASQDDSGTSSKVEASSLAAVR